MRPFTPIAFAAALFASAPGHAQSAGGDDPGHRFAPGLAQTFLSEIQKQLAERRYYDGPTTGEVSPATRAAVAAFQRDVGLPADGIADQAVIDMLNFGPRVMAHGTGATSAPPTPGPEKTALQSRPRAAGRGDDPPPPLASPQPPVTAEPPPGEAPDVKHDPPPPENGPAVAI